MNRHNGKIALLFLIFSLSPLAKAKTELEPMQEDHMHVQSWNQFSERLLDLHHQLIKRDRHLRTDELGGYADHEEFYRQTTYKDAKDHRLISRIQWELDEPKNLHMLEVYVYDEQGQLVRDYLTAYLPRHRNAPIQTLINLHNRTGKLQAYRQFDASGNRIFEHCHGKLNNKMLNIELWEEQLINPEAVIFSSPEYQACFAKLPEELGAYRNPLIDIPSEATASSQFSPFTTSSTLSREEIELQIAILSKQAEQEDIRSQILIQRGAAYFLLHQFEQSIADYNRAIELGGEIDAAYFGRGMSLARGGYIKEGIEDLSEYIARHPQSSLAYTKRGVRYIWLGDLNRAEQDLRKAIQIDERNAEAHDDLGVLFAQRGELDKAITHFRKTLQHDPSYQKAYHNLSMSLYMQSDFQQAEKIIEQALKLKPNDKSALLLKAEILDRRSRHAEAEAIRSEAEFLPQGNWSEQFSLSQDQ